MNREPSARGGLGSVRAVYLVARREFVTRVRGKVFVIGTALTVGLLAVYAILQITVFDKLNTTTTYHLAFTAQAERLIAPLEASGPSLGFRVQATQVSNQAAAEPEVRGGAYDALVTGDPTSPLVVVKTQIDSTLRAALDGVVRQEALDAQLRAAGLNPAAVEAQVRGASIHLDTLQPFNAKNLQQPIIGMIIAFCLYLFISLYGTIIAQGVVAEKASRVVELLLAAVRSGQLLFGKVLGIGLVGVLQLAIIGGAGLALTVPTHILSLPGAALGTVLLGLLWFALGFVLYSLMLASTASLVSRVEEVGPASLPVTMVMVLAWLLAYVVFIPDITAASGGPTPAPGIENLSTIASLIPVFSPVLMPIRLAYGDAPLWQSALAVLLTLSSIAGVTWAGARVYANSVLRFGARIKLSQALRRVA
ncbi:MAG TPA: ABC transporter permease [Candidatus Binatia bacterium]|nr:ABC transporter permease [Candidatus Binatia bacterium]